MRTSFAAALILALYPLAAWAQEKPAEVQSPAPSAWTKERIESPPKREIKFERVAEVKKRQLTRADVKLLETKYAATMKIGVRGGGWESNASAKLKTDAFRRWLNFFFQQSLDTRSYPVGDNERVGLGDAFRAALETMPEGERLGQDIVDYFTSEQIASRLYQKPVTASLGYPGAARDREEPRIVITIELLATTPEQAEQAAAGLLKILDWGVCRTIQQDIWVHREEAEKTLAASRLRMDEYTKAIAPVPDEVAALGTLSSPEAEAGLTTLNVQFLVEQTGIKARIEACDKLMARPGLAPARREKLEDERLKAEVDLASVEARLKALQATTGLAREKRLLQSRKSWLRTLDEYLGHYVPPILVDGTVIVQPIEWQ